MSTRYAGTSQGMRARATRSATYQLRWTPSVKSVRACAEVVLKRKRMDAGRSDLLPSPRAEDALRPHGEHDEKDEVGRHVLESRGEIRAREELDEADGQPAHESAGNGAEAAEHGGREGFEPDEAQIDVHQRHGSEEHAGDGGYARGDGPDERAHQLHGDG